MRLLLLTLFTALASSLPAQSYLGVMIGTEFSSFIQGGDPYGGSLFYTKPRPGLILGLAGGLSLKRRLVLHVEADFATSKTELRRGSVSPGGSSSRVGVYRLDNATLALIPGFHLGARSRLVVGLGGFVSQMTGDPTVAITSGGSFVGNGGVYYSSVTSKLRSEELSSLAYGLQFRSGYRYPISERFSLVGTLNVRAALNDVRQPNTFSDPLRPLRISLRLGALRTF